MLTNTKELRGNRLRVGIGLALDEGLYPERWLERHR